jgi:hypothetical protein
MAAAPTNAIDLTLKALEKALDAMTGKSLE